MGTQTKTVGGGSATGLGNQWVNFLQQGLGGQFGGPSAGAGGMAGTLNGLFGPGAGQVGGAMAKMLQTQQNQSIDALRARYSGMGGLGSALGSGAGSAEAIYRAQAAPQITSAIGQLQLQGLNSIIPSISAMGQRGIPQAQTITQPSPFAQGLSGLTSMLPFLSMLSPSQNTGGGGGGGGNPLDSAGVNTQAFGISNLISMLPMLGMAA